MKEAFKEQEVWYDGLSTFYIGSDGLIHTHIADKMMPDEDSAVTALKSPLATKIAMLMGIMPRSEFLDSSLLSFRESTKEHDLKKVLD